ncbi:uncharacterized protein TEOVI_000445900 [Trypanosoma equiperdum]|uniref:Uncharacterized protein n=1 Tax=Trypanosoma equiperdum TaxID=5694 RepID=A0A1G4IJZ8_TRYEQ|nr:hypothetical protein, conserved [Trypanosoma equiperdum]
MRRSVFFMGRTFTQRHLNACRSPLLTGYVRPTSLACALPTPSVLRGALLGPEASSAVPLGAASDALEGVLSHAMAVMLQSNSITSATLNGFSCLQNISTCVLACERVFKVLRQCDGKFNGVTCA